MRQKIEYSETKKLVKGFLTHVGLSLTQAVKEMNNRYPDGATTTQNISNKLTRESIKFTEVCRIAEICGHHVEFIPIESTGKSDEDQEAKCTMENSNIEFNVNNQRKIQLTQTEPDGAVTVTTWEAERNGVREVESEYQISPGDFVMMLNWYRYQKENGNPDLNF